MQSQKLGYPFTEFLVVEIWPHGSEDAESLLWCNVIQVNV